MLTLWEGFNKTLPLENNSPGMTLNVMGPPQEDEQMKWKWVWRQCQESFGNLTSFLKWRNEISPSLAKISVLNFVWKTSWWHHFVTSFHAKVGNLVCTSEVLGRPSMFFTSISEQQYTKSLDTKAFPCETAGTAGHSRVPPCWGMILACESACIELPSTLNIGRAKMCSTTSRTGGLLGNTNKVDQEIMRRGPVAPCFVTSWLHVGLWCMESADMWRLGNTVAWAFIQVVTAQFLHIWNVSTHTHTRRSKAQQCFSHLLHQYQTTACQHWPLQWWWAASERIGPLACREQR